MTNFLRGAGFPRASGRRASAAGHRSARALPLVLAVLLLVPQSAAWRASIGTRAGPVALRTPTDEVLVAGRWTGAASALPSGVLPAAPFRWPLVGAPKIVSTFAPPPQPWLPGRRGVVLAADAGATVYAAGAGVVTFAGRIGSWGVITVTHANGLRTTYEPVRPSVHRGDHVATGTQLGWIDGRWPACPPTAEACLHWGLRRGDLYLDPLTLLGLAEVRLFPS